MDGGERRASQYGTPYQAAGSRRPAPGQPMGPPDTRYSQTGQPPARSDAAGPSIARPYVPSYQYGYQDPQYHAAQMHGSGAMQGVEMQYTPTYVQDPSRGTHMQPSPAQQHYSAYGQSPMMPPGAQHPMYEGMPQYQQQRQSAAIEVMASQFGGIAPYMQHGEQSSVGVGSAQPHFLTSQPEPGSYGGMSMTRPQLQPPFTPTTTDYTVIEHSDTQGQDDGSRSEAIEEERRQYEENLRAIFNAIVAGRVSEASDKLMPLTRWLLTSVRPLGLHHDDESKHEERLAFWREFNHAWEALGQKQKDITEGAHRTLRQPRDMLSAETMTSMIGELIHLCDQVEKYGLIDYEMGVWEEQIVSIFTQCLDLLGQAESRGEVVTGESHQP